MSYEQKINLKKFVEQLELLKTFGTMIPNGLGFIFFGFKYGKLKPVFQCTGALFFLTMWCINSEYVTELRNFENKIDQSLSDEKK